MNRQRNTLTSLLTLFWALLHNFPVLSQQPDALYLTQVAAAEAYLQMNETPGARHFLEACAPEYRGWNGIF